jgi:hypothetical protein
VEEGGRAGKVSNSGNAGNEKDCRFDELLFCLLYDQAIMDDARGEDERVVVPDDEEEDIIEDADFRIIDDAEFRESVRRQIDNNEPLTVTENGRLLIKDGDDVNGYIPNDWDWKNFGASLGRNTIIEEVTISLNITQMMVQAVHFFRGLKQ